MRLKGVPTITAADFPAAFLMIAAISAASALLFRGLPHDAGAELANRLPPPGPPDRPA